MKIATFALLAVLVGLTGAADAASPIRTNYEVTLQSAGGTWTARSSAAVVSGQPIEHELGPYRLTLTPEIGPSGQYTVEVAVGTVSPAPGAIHVPSRERFAGQLGFPMEFEAVRGGTTIKGALMMDHVGG